MLGKAFTIETTLANIAKMPTKLFIVIKDKLLNNQTANKSNLLLMWCVIGVRLFTIVQICYQT